MGTINSLVALEAGATRVHGTVLGLGERVGNTPIDLLLVNLVLMGWITRDLTHLNELVHAVSEATGEPIPRQLSRVRSRRFPDGYRRSRRRGGEGVPQGRSPTWRIRSTPASRRVSSGRAQEIEVGPLSGKSNVIFWLEHRGIQADDTLVDRIFRLAKASRTVLTEHEILREIDAAGSTALPAWMPDQRTRRDKDPGCDVRGASVARCVALTHMDRGVWYGVAAYSLWGLFPIYWKLFRHVGSLQVLAHRIVWSFLALALVTAAMHRRRTGSWRDVSASVTALYAIAALLIGVNWFFFVWAVNSGFVVETSLGYFITPFVNVLLGVVVFRERLRAPQWAAVALAAAGVLHLTRAYGSLPWIAIGLAISFGSYGLAKKKATLGPLEGLTLETAMLVVPAAVYLMVLHRSGAGVFMRTGAATDLLLAGGGLHHHRAAALVRVIGSAGAALDCRHPSVHCADDTTRPRCPDVPRAVHARAADRVCARLGGPARVRHRWPVRQTVTANRWRGLRPSSGRS